jgi:hypothetical protein
MNPIAAYYLTASTMHLENEDRRRRLHSQFGTQRTSRVRPRFHRPRPFHWALFPQYR